VAVELEQAVLEIAGLQTQVAVVLVLVETVALQAATAVRVLLSFVMQWLKGRK